MSFFLKQDHTDEKQCEVKRCDIKRVCQNMADLPVSFRLVVREPSNIKLFLAYLIPPSLIQG